MEFVPDFSVLVTKYSSWDAGFCHPSLPLDSDSLLIQHTAFYVVGDVDSTQSAGGAISTVGDTNVLMTT